jgi:hypothetical protein
MINSHPHGIAPVMPDQETIDPRIHGCHFFFRAMGHNSGITTLHVDVKLVLVKKAHRIKSGEPTNM